jgi:hypothetical protein
MQSQTQITRSARQKTAITSAQIADQIGGYLKSIWKKPWS